MLASNANTHPIVFQSEKDLVLMAYVAPKLAIVIAVARSETPTKNSFLLFSICCCVIKCSLPFGERRDKS
jgi:hypothetical protein